MMCTFFDYSCLSRGEFVQLIVPSRRRVLTPTESKYCDNGITLLPYEKAISFVIVRGTLR